MITIDFNTAVSCLLSFTLLLVFGIWVFYNSNRGYERKNDSGVFAQCPYCMNVFPEARIGLIRCPCCKSIIEIHENQNSTGYHETSL